MFRKLLVSLGAAAVSLALMAAPATAGQNSGWEYTGDSAPGGRGRFLHLGDKAQACDRQTDGYYVWTYVYGKGRGLNWADVREETTGDCDADRDHDMKEGGHVFGYVCLGGAGKNSDVDFCSHANGTGYILGTA